MSSDGSKYTVPTGPGYQGVWSTSEYSVGIAIGTLTVIDWRPGKIVYAVECDLDNAIAIVEDADPHESIHSIRVVKSGAGVNLQVPSVVTRELEGFEPGDDIRAYKRREGGLYLVPSSDDPMLEMEELP